VGQGSGRQRAGLPEEKDLVPEDHQRGDALDLERRGELLLLVGVDLPEDHVRVVAGGLLEGRGEPTAGSAPGSPEVEDDDATGLDGLPEVLGGDGTRGAHPPDVTHPPAAWSQWALHPGGPPGFDSPRKSPEWAQFPWRMAGNHLQARA